MHSKTIIATATALMGFATAAPSKFTPRASSEPSLTTQLRMADTAIERLALLPDDKDFVFDFSNDTDPANAIAGAKNFPALVGTGASLSIATFDACSMAIVHLHPRAAELQAVVTGRLLTEMVTESGVVDSKGNPRVIRNEVGPKQMTVFYQGSFHTQMNPDCEPAIVVTAFPSEDVGASLIATQALALSDDVIANNLGQTISGADIDAFRDKLPKGVVTSVEQCLAKCKIDKRKF